MLVAISWVILFIIKLDMMVAIPVPSSLSVTLNVYSKLVYGKYHSMKIFFKTLQYQLAGSRKMFVRQFTREQIIQDGKCEQDNFSLYYYHIIVHHSIIASHLKC